MLALGNLKKNTTALGKEIKKVSSGMKINSAGDSAAEYAISERMRVRIRSLEQNQENVKTGSSLLHTAEGGIQNQIDILRNVKRKVIDAANDTNTDFDRKVIQKELTQCYDQMQEIAAETDYNTQRVLLGTDYWKTVYSWDVLDHSVYVDGSDSMGVIPDVYDELDGVTGPFDVFNWPGIQGAVMDSFNGTVIDTPQNFSGGSDGNPNTIDLDLSSYSSVDELDNVGFSVGGSSYILSKNPSGSNYRGNATVIDISGCSSVSDVAAKIASKVHSSVTGTSSGSVVHFTTTNNATAAASNAVDVVGHSVAGGSERISSGGRPAVPEIHIHVSASATGLFNPAKYLDGGDDPFIDPYNDADSLGSYPGAKAKMSQNISSAPNGSGVTVHGPSGTAQLKFVDGNAGLSYDSNTRVYTVGKNANTSGTVAGLEVSLSGGTITFQAPYAGTAYNNVYYVSDGYTYDFDQTASPAVPPTISYVEYTEVKPIDTSGVTNYQTGTDGTYATYDIDVSQYADSTDLDELETVLADLYGKAIGHNTANYEFGDSSILGLGMTSKIDGYVRMLDLNKVRVAVQGGKTIGNALAELLQSVHIATVSTNSNGNVDTITLQAYSRGKSGNYETIVGREGSLRSYDVDYGTWFANNPDAVIPDDLYNKGFRVYCATCQDQWFNFIFQPTLPEDADECLESGTDTEDIKTIRIDVGNVTDAESLVRAIYEKAAPILEGKELPYLESVVDYDHFMRIAADPNRGILTLYDTRKHALERMYYPELSEVENPKIADGCYDNVLLSDRDLSAKRLVIQHTDHASLNLHMIIPRTTLDHVFGFNPEYSSIDDYNVYTLNHRNKLLGEGNKKGLLDKGITYLLDANTIVGAQIMRLEKTHDTIVTTTENEQHSESTIRDADMAREMTEYTKASVLSQASQAILAQANQNSSSVLSLLQ